MLKIALDIDDTLVSWEASHEKKFKVKLSDLTETQITKQVLKCRHDKNFWTNLPLLEKPDFIPYIYCTKRINSKNYTKENFKKLGLPIRPIYQIYNLHANKAWYIKGIADILIDDSYTNVIQCINSGFPALLITRDRNKHINTPYRINKLCYKEIEQKYNELF